MTLHAVCPQCHKSWTLPNEVGGKKIRCKNCQAIFPVVSADQQLDEREGAHPNKIAADVPELEAVEPAEGGKEIPVLEAVDALDAVEPAEEDTEAVPRPANARRSSSKLPILFGVLLAGFLLMCGGGVVLALLLQLSPQPTPVVNVPPAPPPSPVRPRPLHPVTVPARLVTVTATPEVSPPSVPPPSPAVDVNLDAKEAAKRATALLRVTLPDGTKAYGLGFFGSPESPNLLVTNARVVGMSSADSAKPKKIEVALHSGQAELEDEGQAQLLGVDPATGLAVLELYPTTKRGRTLPKPVALKTGEKLAERAKVSFFRVPSGDAFGKQLMLRDTTVASRVKEGGLHTIQVKESPDESNGGGPLLDEAGHVVGIAASGSRDLLTNQVIPGERVQALLDGWITGTSSGQPYLTPANKIAVPVTAELLDPRGLVKDVFLEVWIGADTKQARPMTTNQPDPLPGDTPRQRFQLATASGRERKGELQLPPLPNGQAYWVQPGVVTQAGGTRWQVGEVYKLPSQPVERKGAELAFKPQVGTHKDLTLTNELSLKVDKDKDSLFTRSTTKVVFDAFVKEVTPRGATVILQYTNAERTDTIKVGDKGVPEDFEPAPNEALSRLGTRYRKVKASQSYDSTGNLRGTDIVPMSAVELPAPVLLSFHMPVVEALNTVAVSMPNKTVAPNESWKARREFSIQTPEKRHPGTFDMTYTYLGQRKRDDRTDAVIAIAGELHGIDEKTVKVFATLTGTATVDLATGEVISAQTRLRMEQQMKIKPPDGTNPVTVKVRAESETHADYAKPK